MSNSIISQCNLRGPYLTYGGSTCTRVTNSFLISSTAKSGATTYQNFAAHTVLSEIFKVIPGILSTGIARSLNTSAMALTRTGTFNIIITEQR